MPRRFVDLSIYLENDVLSDPPPLAPRITYQKHADTLPEFMAMIPGTKPEDYPDGEAAAVTSDGIADATRRPCRALRFGCAARIGTVAYADAPSPVSTSAARR